MPDKYKNELLSLLGGGVRLEEVVLCHGTWIGKLFGKFKQYAVTFGKNIHFTPKAKIDQWQESERFALIAHECYHVKQYTALGFLPFLLLYGMGRITIFFLRRKIWDHPMEMPAYDIQRMAKDHWEIRHPG